MIPLVVIIIYLAIIAYIGSAAFRRSKENTEDFFLASRTIGPMVFFLSLFATNMTAVAILGSSGFAYRRGIGIYGLMASSSGFIIPLTVFFIGTRIWAMGRKFGHQTQVALFRDRWESSSLGTAIFILSAAMLVPYMIVSIIGGGRVLADISLNDAGQSLIPYWLGCLIVTLVVTLNVFLGGMRGVVWVNIFQTILFLVFGAIAMAVINAHIPGGIAGTLEQMQQPHVPPLKPLLTRERIPELEFFSYTFIPLSSIMFPHMSIMCLSARKMSAFKRTVILYPLAIMAIWLPCVLLGALGAKLAPGLDKPDGVLLRLLAMNAPAWLAGILGAGIISAVMGSDCHQVLALSTMFTKDIFEHYGGKEKYGEKGSILFARIFILAMTALAYVIALFATAGIFEIAVRFAFTGFAALAPIMVAALFWKRSTRAGAMASTLFVAASVIGTAVINNTHRPGEVLLQVGSTPVLYMTSPPPRPGKPGGPAARPGTGGPAAGRPGLAPGNAPAGMSAGATNAPVGVGGPAGSAGPRAEAGNRAGGAPGAGALAGGGPGTAGGAPKPQPFSPDLRLLGFMSVVPIVIGSALLMLIVSLVTAPPSKATLDRYFPPADGRVDEALSEPLVEPAGVARQPSGS